MFGRTSKCKIYASNIADIVTVASTTIANVTIVAYYLDRLTVKINVFKPTQKQSIGIIEVCFINGHYDLIVNTTAQAELEYDSTIFNLDFKTAKETLQKFPPYNVLNYIRYNSFHQHNV